MPSVRSTPEGPPKAARGLGSTRTFLPVPNLGSYGAFYARWCRRLAVRLMGPPAGLSRDEDPVGRVRKCGWVRLMNTVSVEVERESGRGRYGGLMACGSIWACPVCSANIRHQRSLEIEQGALEWLRRGGALVMVTLTTRHHRGMPLDDLWQMVIDAFGHLRSGRPSQRLRHALGEVGYVRSLEVTTGRNGWHPHLHLLLFVKGDPEAAAARIEHEWGERWCAFIGDRGFPRPQMPHAVHARAVTKSDVGDYLAKVQDGYGGEWGPSQEIARGDLKRPRGESGQTPFGLIDEYVAGDLSALAAWREYEAHSKGRSAIRWSRGLRDLLGVDEVSDGVAAERAQWQADPVWVLTDDEWDVVISANADYDLLVAAEEGGQPAVVAMLLRLFGFDSPEDLACPSCEWNTDGHRTRSCSTCLDRLRTISGRTDHVAS